MEISRSEIMIRYVEKYYQESKFYTAQNNAKGEEFDLIHSIIEDMPNQFHPQTATWGLRLWEEMMGIDGGVENIEERRNNLLMKLMTLPRITPISLERLIKNIAKADVEVIRNIAPYTFQVRIKDNSLECNNRLIRKIIENYKEAHMAFYQVYDMGKVVIQEKFYFRTIHHLIMYWFRTDGLLNGDFLLDGSRLLNTDFPLYRLSVCNCFYMPFKETIFVKGMFNRLNIKIKEKLMIRSLFRYRFIWWGNKLPKYKIKVINPLQVKNKERFSIPIIKKTHNLWHLDGVVNLDGSRVMDAYQIEEVCE